MRTPTTIFASIVIAIIFTSCGTESQKTNSSPQPNQSGGRISPEEFASVPLGSSKSFMIKKIGEPFTFARMVNVPERVCVYYLAEETSDLAKEGATIIGKNGGYAFCLWNGIVDNKRVEQLRAFREEDLRPR